MQRPAFVRTGRAARAACGPPAGDLPAGGGRGRSSRSHRQRTADVRRYTSPASCDAAAFALGSSAPNTVLYVVLQRVLQALALHGALGAVVACHFHPNPVAGEEDLWGKLPATPLHHPGSVQFDLRTLRVAPSQRVQPPHILDRFPGGWRSVRALEGVGKGYSTALSLVKFTWPGRRVGRAQGRP